MPIFCSLCRIAFFSPRQCLSHLKSHNLEQFKCGVNACDRAFRNFSTFANHLRICHSNFYPILLESPEFTPDSVFSSNNLRRENENVDNVVVNNLNIEENENVVANNLNIDENVALDFLVNERDVFDVEILNKVKRFVSILIEYGCKKNVPFSVLKDLCDNLINFFSDMDNSLPEFLILRLKEVISSQESFDHFLDLNHSANFPVTVDIANTDYTFFYFPLEKSIDQVLLNFNSKNDICRTTENSNSPLLNQFFSKYNARFDCIYLNLYSDDFTISNPLLSKKSIRNITGIYFRIVSTDPSQMSAKKYIKPLVLVETSIYKFHSEVIYGLLGNVFNELKSNGVNVNFGQNFINLGLDLAFFSTDSKEASFILGFKYGFNHHYCCRTCIVPKGQFSSIRREDYNLMRSKQSFLDNANIGLGLADGLDSYGQVKLCSVRFFNVETSYQIFPPCIAHDVHEGTSKKFLNIFITKLINQFNLPRDFISIFFNDFNLFGKDKQYFPKVSFEQNFNLRLTAIESHTLIRFLPLILAKFLNVDIEIFQIVVVYVKFVNSIMVNEGSELHGVYIDSLVEEFLILLSKYFPDEQLSIKFHHLIHYGSYFDKFGPLKLFSTINFEAIHSDLKKEIRSSRNWINPCLTIANKYARANCCSFLSSDNFKILHNRNIPLAIQNTAGNNKVCEINQLEFRGKIYKPGMGIIFAIELEYVIYKIANIYLCENDDFYMLGDEFEASFSENLNIYSIQRCLTSSSLKTIDHFSYNSAPHIIYVNKDYVSFVVPYCQNHFF